MASYRVVMGRWKVCIIDQLTILCFPSYSSIDMFDNDISGWLTIAQWLVTSVTVCNNYWFFYQIIFMWRHSRVSVQARSAGYIPRDGLSIRHPWWIHLREKLIIWWNTYHVLLVPSDASWFREIFTLVSKMLSCCWVWLSISGTLAALTVPLCNNFWEKWPIYYSGWSSFRGFCCFILIHTIFIDFPCFIYCCC